MASGLLWLFDHNIAAQWDPTREAFIVPHFSRTAMALGGEESVQIVWSHCLGQGSETGFAFLFRPDRLSGAAKATKETLVLIVSSGAQLRIRLPRKSLFHRDPRAPSEVPMTPEMVREIFGPKGMETLRPTGISARIVAKETVVTRDPVEVRRIAEQLGVDLDELVGPDALRPAPWEDTTPEKPPGQPSAVTNAGGWTAAEGSSINPTEILATLQAARVFDLPWNQIERIEIAAPAASQPGRIVIRAPGAVEVVNVTAPI